MSRTTQVSRLSALVLAALLGGVLLGGLGGSGAPLVIVLLGLSAPAFLVASLIRPSLGLLVLICMVFTHASDVAVTAGAPSVLQPFLLMLILALVANCVRRGELPDGLAAPAALLAAYGGVLALSLFHVQDFDTSFLVVTGFLRDAVIALLVVALLRTGLTLERSIWVLVLSGGALAAAGVLQYATGSFDQELGGFAQASVKNIADDNDDFRISGPIADPNHWAQALLVVVPLALGRMRGSRSPLGRALAGAALVATVLAVILTFSRGALVALVMLAVLAMILRPPPVWSLALVAVLAVVALPLLPPGYTDRLGQLAQAVPGVSAGKTDEASLSGRLSALRAGQDMVLDNPVIGVGAGQFQDRYRAYSLGKGIDTAKGGVAPHNMLLEVAAESGYLGLVAWGAILAVCARRLWQGRQALRRAGRWREAALVEDLSLALTAYLLSGLFVHNAYPRLFWLLIGAAFAVPVVVRSVLAGPRTAPRGLAERPTRLWTPRDAVEGGTGS